MKALVYILEDDEGISGLVRVALEMNGISVSVFSTVAEFKAAAEKLPPEAALLDIMLPDGSGFEALAFLKRRYPETRCIVLSALGKEEDKVKGLNLGADDYISKPFSVLELVARVNARLRRAERPPVLCAGGVTLDCETMTAEAEGRALPLNKKEFELLKYFIERAGKALTRERILNDVWGYDAGETRTLDNHVARLRKLGIRIETIFGVGYKFPL